MESIIVRLTNVKVVSAPTVKAVSIPKVKELHYNPDPTREQRIITAVRKRKTIDVYKLAYAAAFLAWVVSSITSL